MNYFILSDGTILNLSNVTSIYSRISTSEYKYEVRYTNTNSTYITSTDYNNILNSLKYRNLVVNG
jgi:hypothetical protein